MRNLKVRTFGSFETKTKKEDFVNRDVCLQTVDRWGSVYYIMIPQGPLDFTEELPFVLCLPLETYRRRPTNYKDISISILNLHFWTSVYKIFLVLHEFTDHLSKTLKSIISLDKIPHKILYKDLLVQKKRLGGFREDLYCQDIKTV